MALPAGSFRVRVEKPGFVALEYGAKWPFVQPLPITLRQGQSFAADLVLPRGASLEGRLVGDTGEPLQNATVSAVLCLCLGGGRV